MSVQVLSSRAIIGAIFNRLSQATGIRWIDLVAMLVTSDQESEEYGWLGMVPRMRLALGGRQAKGLRDFSQTITNDEYEATLEIPTKWLRRDKTGQILIRIGELAEAEASHWASLLSTLIVNGESTLCYDGQFFFDDDHVEGDSGTQSNDISVDISELPVTNKGSITAPSVGQMGNSILQGVQQIFGFKDDQGEPMNELARQFVVMVPTTLLNTARSAISLPMVDAGESNIIPATPDFSIGVVPNARLNDDWTDRFAVFRTDAETKALIKQSEVGLDVSAVAEGSELEFRDFKHQYGLYASRAVGYGFWQRACLVTMT